MEFVGAWWQPVVAGTVVAGKLSPVVLNSLHVIAVLGRGDAGIVEVRESQFDRVLVVIEHQSSVVGGQIASHAVDVHHGDDGSSGFFGCAGIQSLRFQNHHAIGGAKQQSPVGQHGCTVFAVDVAFECMSELIRVHLPVLADAGDTIVGTSPHIALSVGRDAQDIVGNQSVVCGVALLDAELAVLVAAFLQSAAASAHPDVACRVGHQARNLVEGEVAMLDVMTAQVVVGERFLHHVDMINAVVGGQPVAVMAVGADDTNQALVVRALHQVRDVQQSVGLQSHHKQSVAPGGNPQAP